MGVTERVDDARFLWAAGRREGALLCVLTAVAASARRTFPNVKGDRAVFVRYLQDSIRGGSASSTTASSGPSRICFTSSCAARSFMRAGCRWT